jgi:hypothetical protein
MGTIIGTSRARTDDAKRVVDLIIEFGTKFVSEFHARERVCHAVGAEIEL